MPLRPPLNSNAAAWILAIIAAIAPILVTGTADAAPPPDIGRYSSMTRVGSTERDAIRKYAEYWGEQLGSGKPGEVLKAEKRLSDAATAPGATLVFSDAYADAVIPHLKAILQSKDEYRQFLQPVNAMKVAAALGTEDALKLIVDHCDMNSEPRASVRLWAAIGFRLIIEKAAPNELRKPLPMIRRLGEAAAIEEDPWVLARQFQAIAATNENISIQVTLNTLDAVTERLRQQKQGTALFLVVQPAIVGLRDEFLEVNQDELRELAIKIAPRLAVLLEVAEAHWPPDDEELRPGYVSTIKLLEQNLQAIDAAVNQSAVIKRSELEKSFREGNREQYRSGLEAIRNELSQPPYR